jgi:hypothetical protein
MSYINADDVSANIAVNFELEPYIEEADGEIDDLAEKLGVRDSTSIKTDPLHYKIKRYAIVYVLMRLCQDKAGTNNVDLPEVEKYLVLYKMYQKELEQLRSQISVEMMTGEVSAIRDRAINTGEIYRG